LIKKRFFKILGNHMAFGEKIQMVTGDISMQTENIKDQARRLVDDLPESATWEDVMYRIYVRQAVDAGIKDSDEGRTIDVKEVRKRLGLPA
jgi:uncharacterized protein YjbJ (UPF0337 family)